MQTMIFPLITFLLPSLTSGFSSAEVSSNVVPPSSIKAHDASSSPPLCMSKDNPSSKFDLPIFDLPLEYTMQSKFVIWLWCVMHMVLLEWAVDNHDRRLSINSATAYQYKLDSVENNRSAVYIAHDIILPAFSFGLLLPPPPLCITVSSLVYRFADLRTSTQIWTRGKRRRIKLCRQEIPEHEDK